MPDINDIHRFFECNLPGYQRRDNIAVVKFFVEKSGIVTQKPFKAFLAHFDHVREFVVFYWLGENEIRDKRFDATPVMHLPTKSKKKKKGKQGFGKCSCGGSLVKRKNRSDRSVFLGCNNWPKCTNTKPYLL